MSKKYMTIDELSSYIGVPKSQISRWVEYGYFKPIYKDHKIYFNEETVEIVRLFHDVISHRVSIFDLNDNELEKLLTTIDEESFNDTINKVKQYMHEIKIAS